MPFSAQARLALDILAAAPRLGLAAEDPQWNALLDSVLASVPRGFKQARMALRQSGGEPLDGHAPGQVVLGFSPTDTLDEDQLLVNVWVALPHIPPTRAEDAAAYISEIRLTASFAAVGDGDPASFDGLRAAAGSAHFDELQFFVREGNALDEEGMQALVRSMLRREQFTWALDRDVLRMASCVINSKTGNWKGIAYIDSGALLSVLSNRSVPTIDATPPTLDDDEYAEYLSMFVEDKRAGYLQQLPALRVERAKAKARLLAETPGSPAHQVTAGPAPHTSAAGHVGGGEVEERNV
ncbi:hypothetical protein PsYK624_146840 [Phanerochaete sordida]|uniref:Uncharacterized protein n=1 Tax=Phanerochaete sordida TaxID=48140 RepID=A0A9P3GN35_9APHY|nr:hypothetical protein PsYK624_146840 [Phanerochaete sordida]